MNKLITTNVGGFPPQLDDYRFLDDAYRAAFLAICKGLLKTSQTSEAFILVGCEIVETPPESGIYVVSPGYIYLNGEICEVSETTIIPAGGETIYYTFGTTYDFTGFKTFKDGQTYNTYEVRRCQVIASSTEPSTAYISWINVKTLKQVIQGIFETRFTTVENKVANIEAAWSLFTYNANNFYTNGTVTTWTVSDANEEIRYKINGKTMHVDIKIATSEVNTGYSYTELIIKIPGTKSVPTGKSYHSVARCFKGETESILGVEVSGSVIKIFGSGAGGHELWQVYGGITFEIN